ncbi:hypothetical protein Agub_g6366, partial [Astrephomene gubernaculifera]
EEESPAVLLFRQFTSLSHEGQVAKVESYARMDERQLQELPYLDQDAHVAITALRQAMHMVELFGAVAALRADEDFQSDIRDPRVRDALAEAKRTNNLERYEDQPAVMSVAAKFKRLHAISRKTDGLQVVIDDLRAELPDNDPASTAAKMGEMRAMLRTCAGNAVQAVLNSVTAALPERLRSRLATPPGGGDGGGDDTARGPAGAGAAAVESSGGSGSSSGAAGERDGAQTRKQQQGSGVAQVEEVEEEQEEEEGRELTEEERRERQARLAHRARMDRLRAAATSAWSGGDKADDAVGYVDRLERDMKARARKGGAQRRKRLADYVGEEAALSLQHTFRALLITLLGFAVMWWFGLMPYQQEAAVLAQEAAMEAAARAAAAAAAAAAAGEAGAAQGAEAAGGSGLLEGL